MHPDVRGHLGGARRHREAQGGIGGTGAQLGRWPDCSFIACCGAVLEQQRHHLALARFEGGDVQRGTLALVVVRVGLRVGVGVSQLEK